MAEVSEVRQRGVMVGIDLGDHDAALQMGHRVTIEARERGAFVRPLGDIGRADATALDLRGGAARAGRDHGRVDRGRRRHGAAPGDRGRLTPPAL